MPLDETLAIMETMDQIRAQWNLKYPNGIIIRRKEMTLKIGIVGAGKMVQMAHLPNIIRVDGVELVAIADLDIAAAQKVANAYNIPQVYGNSQELLDGESELMGLLS